VRLPIVKRFSVENFLSPKTRTFGSVFRTPWKNPWTDLSETYGHVLPSQALRPAIYGAKQRLAVFTEIRLIKKKEEKHAQNITAFRTRIRRTGGCKNITTFGFCSTGLVFSLIQVRTGQISQQDSETKTLGDC